VKVARFVMADFELFTRV